MTQYHHPLDGINRTIKTKRGHFDLILWTVTIKIKLIATERRLQAVYISGKRNERLILILEFLATFFHVPRLVGISLTGFFLVFTILAYASR